MESKKKIFGITIITTIMLILVVSSLISVFAASNTTKTATVWPVEPIVQLLPHDKFGYRTRHYVYGTGRNHYGLDITVPIGTSVKAVADGKVIKYSTYAGSNGDEDYGKVLWVESTINGKKYKVLYAHLSSTKVKTGDKIKQGQVIAKSGNTGGSRIPHLHIEFRDYKTGKQTDPLKILPSKNFSKLPTKITKSKYTNANFPQSSRNLQHRMADAAASKNKWDYIIYGQTTKAVGGIPKNATIKLVSRNSSTNKVTVTHQGKKYYNLPASSFKFSYSLN